MSAFVSTDLRQLNDYLSRVSRMESLRGLFYLNRRLSLPQSSGCSEKAIFLEQILNNKLAGLLSARYSDWRKCHYASWSHTDEWLALWVGRNKCLIYGLDIENPRRVTYEILRRISHPFDTPLVQLSSLEMPLLWSVKEASFKALSRLVPELRVMSQIGVFFWQKIDPPDVHKRDLTAFRFKAVATLEPSLSKESGAPQVDLSTRRMSCVRGIGIVSSELQIAVAEGPIQGQNKG